MALDIKEKSQKRGPYKPTLIIHGGAGAISRANLPPELYKRYHKSLTDYLVSTKEVLDHGSSALDAACHAVSLLEDDPLFNCGRGAVFTNNGTIEMEASVMVASVADSGPPEGAIKRAGAVSLIRNTRHPILLAKEVLLDADEAGGLGGTSTMHCHVSGRSAEEWGWKEKGLERKPDDWFWTKRRWDEHQRGLEDMAVRRTATDGSQMVEAARLPLERDNNMAEEDVALPSQGTVGAVCFDSWGNIAVATSTGGLTNKAPGRIGDTPTVGAGFWAESWKRSGDRSDAWTPAPQGMPSFDWIEGIQTHMARVFTDCLPLPQPSTHQVLRGNPPGDQTSTQRHVVAMSGTGNGDSFLRMNAVRSAAAISRFSPPCESLQDAVSVIAGPGGALQKSTGDRWLRTGEGQGGIIGIELSKGKSAQVVFDFNCGGLWRAYYTTDPSTGKEVPKVMVFREEYLSQGPLNPSGA